jgi:anti-sigma regulatory factor (Ser/Thr protein kinase)
LPGLCITDSVSAKLPVKLRIDDVDQISVFREQIRSGLENVAGGDAGLIYVGFNEALNNAVLHSGAQKKPITVKLNVIAERILVIRIKHQGLGFSGNQLLAVIRDQEKNSFEAVLDQESSRGLLLINSIFHKVHYNRDGTEIMIVKYL